MTKKTGVQGKGCPKHHRWGTGTQTKRSLKLMAFLGAVAIGGLLGNIGWLAIAASVAGIFVGAVGVIRIIISDFRACTCPTPQEVPHG